MFDAALGEPIRNAIVHNDGETPRVSIFVSEDSRSRGMTEIRVEDDGSGIPEDVPRILARSEHDQVDHLDGMGLWFVYWTVTESGGELGIEDSELGGSCVRMWLPQRVSITPEVPMLPARRSLGERSYGPVERRLHDCSRHPTIPTERRNTYSRP